jgi:hypothetical protein
MTVASPVSGVALAGAERSETAELRRRDAQVVDPECCVCAPQAQNPAVGVAQTLSPSVFSEG